MFKKLFLLAALGAVATSAPADSYESHHGYDSVHIPILKDEREGPDAYGNYNFDFETGNGINRQEQGAPSEYSGAVASQGRIFFTFPDGTPFELFFEADEQGYRPQSDHLPVAPPMPQHAIDQILFAQQQKAAGYSPPSHEYD